MNKQQAEALLSYWGYPARDSFELKLQHRELPLKILYLSAASEITLWMEWVVLDELIGAKEVKDCGLLSIILVDQETAVFIVNSLLSQKQPSTVEVLIDYLVEGDYFKKAVMQALMEVYKQGEEV